MSYYVYCRISGDQVFNVSKQELKTDVSVYTHLVVFYISSLYRDIDL